MPRISEWSPNEALRLFIFGRVGSGKTEGAATFPRPVFLDFDDGMASLRNPGFIKRHGMSNVFYETFSERSRNRAGVTIQHNAYDDSCRFFDAWMAPTSKWTGANGKVYDVGRDLFDTWVLDSVTTLSEAAMHKGLIVMGGWKLSKTQEEGMSKGLVVPKVQDYGAERSLVEQYVQMLLDSGKNVIVLAHEKELTDDKGNILAIVPLVTGQSAERIPLKFDESYNLRIRPDGLSMKRYLQTEPDGLRRCKSRYGIPNESSWTWEAVHGALQTIHAQQQTQPTPT